MIEFTEQSLADTIEQEAALSRDRRAQDAAAAPQAAQRFAARLARHAAERSASAVPSDVSRLPRAGAMPRTRRSLLLAATTIVAIAASMALVVQTARTPAYTEETLQARAGARVSATLADGSRVELRGGSRMRVRMPAKARWWSQWMAPTTLTAQRLVELTGEAKFEVVHDPRHPFRVIAGGVNVDDIGTVFGVRAYATDSAVRVVVTEGAVSVQPVNGGVPDGISLAAGDMATISAAGLVRVARGDSAGAMLSWTGDRLSFRDTPLAEVLRDLERTFGRPVVLADPTAGAQPVTITLDANRLDVALRSLGALLNVVPQAAGDTLVLAPRKIRP